MSRRSEAKTEETPICCAAATRAALLIAIWLKFSLSTACGLESSLSEDNRYPPRGKKVRSRTMIVILKLRLHTMSYIEESSSLTHIMNRANSIYIGQTLNGLPLPLYCGKYIEQGSPAASRVSATREQDLKTLNTKSCCHLWHPADAKHHPC